ncbi:MAG: hypothetical protein ACI35S_06780 [Anaeroplasma sp.]
MGGSKAVFVGLKGIKNELVFYPFGGQIKNPFKGAAKMFAGDLVEYRTNSDGLKPEIYILKTYLVHSVSDTTLNLVKDGYKHTPFVGDIIGAAPDTIGGAMDNKGTITSIKVTKIDSVDVWQCTLDSAITASQGDVLVEANSDGEMVVKNINGVFDSDVDFVYAPATGDEDFDGARYHFVPAMGGTMYINRMSSLPKCVLAKNESKVNGWFTV